MTARWKRGALALLLVVTLIAAWRAPQESNEGVALSSQAHNALGRPAAATQQPASAQAAQVDVLGIHPRDADEDGADRDGRLFASTALVSPAAQMLAAAPVQEPAPAPPQAPALPFQFLGRYDEAGQVVVLLQHQDQNLAVRQGDTVAGHYRVESLQGATMTFRYLPLDQVQTLDVGGGQ